MAGSQHDCSTEAHREMAWPVQSVQSALFARNCLGFGGLEWAMRVQILQLLKLCFWRVGAGRAKVHRERAQVRLCAVRDPSPGFLTSPVQGVWRRPTGTVTSKEARLSASRASGVT